MEKKYNISNIFTLAIAGLLLVVSSFGNAVAHTRSHTIAKETKKEPKKDKSKHIVSSLALEAVVSPVIEAFDLYSVNFQPIEFKFFIVKSLFNSFQIFFKSQVFEILFEHLAAPNAP